MLTATDDFWCVHEDTRITLSINLGTRPPTFAYYGTIIEPRGNFAAADVYAADIDGDGRADVCFLEDNGDIRCSRNGGQSRGPDDRNYYWQGFSDDTGVRSIVFTGKNKGDKRGVRLADLNGEYVTSPY